MKQTGRGERCSMCFSRLPDSNLALQHCRESRGVGGWWWCVVVCVWGGGGLSYAETMTILECTHNKSIPCTESVKSAHFCALKSGFFFLTSSCFFSPTSKKPCGCQSARVWQLWMLDICWRTLHCGKHIWNCALQ